MDLLNEYNQIIQFIDNDKKRYIHYKSLHNFITQLNMGIPKNEVEEIELEVRSYLKIVKEEALNIDSQMGLEFFQVYVNPIGEKLKHYGFSRVTPFRYLILFAVMIDSLIFIAFFPFFFPICLVCVIVYFFLIHNRKLRKKKCYGLFY
jgi:cbb3-type cytochrome oxidase subunit 3